MNVIKKNGISRFEKIKNQGLRVYFQGYTMNLLMLGDKKRPYALKQTYSFSLQVCLSTYGIKGLTSKVCTYIY